MSRPVILSGFRPTGPMHIGHLKGAIENWVRLQDTHLMLNTPPTRAPNPIFTAVSATSGQFIAASMRRMP